MPIVHIELLPGRTREQKASAALEITHALERTLGASPQTTDVIFVEVEKHNWAREGKLFE